MAFNVFTTPQQQWVYDARCIASKMDGITADECYMFGDIMEFLFEFPEFVTKKRGRLTRPNILIEKGVYEVAERWYEGRKQKVGLRIPATITDPAVLAILAPANSDLSAADEAHRMFMAAENVIGSLLERYIASELEHFGWVWASGEVIRAVDFLKKADDGGIVALQVKNRSNSENSSSAAVRIGTNINKWHRIDARTGKTFWDRFPQKELVGVLTEEGFQKYIKENLA